MEIILVDPNLNQEKFSLIYIFCKEIFKKRCLFIQCKQLQYYFWSACRLNKSLSQSAQTVSLRSCNFACASFLFPGVVHSSSSTSLIQNKRVCNPRHLHTHIGTPAQGFRISYQINILDCSVRKRTGERTKARFLFHLLPHPPSSV